MGAPINPVMWNIPALPPPPGMKSNFDGHSNAGRPLVIMNVILLSLMLTLVSIRIISRLFITGHGFGWDDATCIFAAIASIGHSVLIFQGIGIWYGRHMWDIRAVTLTQSRMLELTMSDTAYILTVYSIKISILLLYFRLFSIRKSTRVLIYVGIIFTTVTTAPFLAFSFVRNVKCTTMFALITPICQHEVTWVSQTIFSVTNLMNDFYILAIPIRDLHGLKLEHGKKVRVISLFMAGFIACSMSIVRLVIVGKNYGGNDILFAISLISYFTTAEVNLAIICSCMVFFPSFLRHVRLVTKRIFSTSSYIEKITHHIPCRNKHDSLPYSQTSEIWKDDLYG